MVSSGSPETREAILEAAWERITEGGPLGLKLGAVARDADVSRQAIYLHFGSRGGLLLALVDFIDQKFQLADYFADLPDTDDPVAHLLDLLRVTARYAPKIQEVGLAFEFTRHQDEDIQAAFDDRMTQRLTQIRGAVAAIADAGRLADGWTVDQVADAIWALGKPSFYDSVVTERGWTVAQYEEFLVRVVRSTFVIGPG